MHQHEHPSLSMIGNAHLDPAWMWEWGEGMEAFIATCRSALERMNETPEVVFTCSSAAHYQWIEEVDPELFQQIQERVAQGRWEIVGGWWTQADCNLPSGEGFIRQALLGQRYFLEKFGRMASIGYSPDAFGHNAGLPQLLAGSGLLYYIFCRPDPDELELPSPLFRWFSTDGSSVLAYRVPFHYNMYQTSVPKKIADITHACCASTDLAANGVPLLHFGNEWALFYGMGNHGGGPTKEQIRQIIEAGNDPEQPEVRFARLDDFFRKAEREPGRIVPEWREDLQLNAPGCYSVHSKIKRLNREAEHKLVRAEILSLMGEQLLNLKEKAHAQRQTELTRAWENVCFNHFHDILCGVAVPDALETAVHYYGEALAIADRITQYSLRRIAGRINTHGSGQTLLVMNPNAFPLDHYLTFELWHDIDKELWGQPVHLSLTDDVGKELPVGSVQSAGKIGKDRVAGTFRARVPAYGWRCYRVHYGERSLFYGTEGLVEASQTVLENSYMRAEFSETNGCIISLFHKTSGIELIDDTDGGAAMPTMIRDQTDTWGHGTERFNDVIGTFNQAEVVLVEQEPTHGTIRVTGRWGSSWIQQDFTLYAESPVLHVRVRVLQGEPHTMITLRFPTTLTDPQTVVESSYTSVQKQCDGTERPCGSWKSIVGAVRGHDDLVAGLGIADTLVHGYSAEGAMLSLTLLRSPAYATHDPHQVMHGEDVRYVDMGETEFHYTIRPFVGEDFRTQLMQDSIVLNRPPLLSLESSHDGGIRPLPRTYSGAESSATNVQVVLMKSAADANGDVVRLFETEGRQAQATVRIPLLHTEFNVAMRPHEVKTFRIVHGRAIETDLVEIR